MTVIDRQMRQVLAQLELVSHGQTQAWNPTGATTSDQVLPPGEPNPPHIVYRRRYRHAISDHQRQRILQTAQAEWRDLTGRSHKPRPAGETVDQRAMRLVREGEGLTLSECALMFNCSPSAARRARLADGRQADDGRPTEPLAGDLSLAQRAHELRARNLTLRQIGLLLGKDQRQIQRYLARPVA